MPGYTLRRISRYGFRYTPNILYTFLWVYIHKKPQSQDFAGIPNHSTYGSSIQRACIVYLRTNQFYYTAYYAQCVHLSLTRYIMYTTINLNRLSHEHHNIYVPIRRILHSIRTQKVVFEQLSIYRYVGLCNIYGTQYTEHTHCTSCLIIWQHIYYDTRLQCLNYKSVYYVHAVYVYIDLWRTLYATTTTLQTSAYNVYDIYKRKNMVIRGLYRLQGLKCTLYTAYRQHSA